MSEINLRDIARGGLALRGPAETRQGMCYLPDRSRAAVAVAEKPHELTRVEGIVVPGHTLLVEGINSELERITGAARRSSVFHSGYSKSLAPSGNSRAN